MFEMMSQQALSVGAARRRELAIETMRDARQADRDTHHTVGVALVGFGQRVAGEMPAKRSAQPDRDCVETAA